MCPGSEGAVLKIVGCKRLAGANPSLFNSTAKIKHCYGVIAGALMAAGNQIHRDTIRNDAKPLQSEFLPNGG